MNDMVLALVLENDEIAARQNMRRWQYYLWCPIVYGLNLITSDKIRPKLIELL
jgi:hypothetical protein